MRSVSSFSLAAAALFMAARDTRSSGRPITLLDDLRDIDIRPAIKDRPARSSSRKTRRGNRSGHMPHQGIGEIARRQRQVAAGRLRAANGLRP